VPTLPLLANGHATRRNPDRRLIDGRRALSTVHRRAASKAGLVNLCSLSAAQRGASTHASHAAGTGLRAARTVRAARSVFFAPPPDRNCRTLANPALAYCFGPSWPASARDGMRCVYVSKYQVSTTASATSSMWKWRGPAGDGKCWGHPAIGLKRKFIFDESVFLILARLNH
jgi:hypothetical protein